MALRKNAPGQTGGRQGLTIPRKTTGLKPRLTAASKTSTSKRREESLRWKLKQVLAPFRNSPKTPIPAGLKSMSASVKEEAFNDPSWQFEIKWDGYRCLAYNTADGPDLRSRNNLSLNAKFRPIADALQAWPLRVVLDGEAVILSDDGKADFAALQNYSGLEPVNLRYYVFDVLWVEGIDLRAEPLHVRRRVLKQLIPENGIIRFSESIDECGIDFLQAARQNGLEGIIAKRKDSVYTDGVRTKDWYKIKLACRHEAVICGYTKQKGSERLFSSLVLGVPGNDGWRYIGQVGTGFSGKSQRELFEKMNPLFTNKCPFDKKPATGAATQWVTPALVCEIKFTEMTADGLMRHPSFQGLRDDKSIRDIHLNEQCAVAPAAAKTSLLQPTAAALPVDQKKVSADVVKFSHLTKVYWPKAGFTKGDVIRYYREMAPYILPYLQSRPQSLHRFPNGIAGNSFYQKDVRGTLPPWAETFERRSDSDGDVKNYLVCNGEESLLYMANLGCIEMHPWHSRVSAPLRPDWCVIDLDPGAIPFSKVVETANVVRDVLVGMGVPSYPKTSGATGLHIYIPLGAKYSYAQSRQLAELVANLVHDELPRFTSLERNPQKRKDKIYLDYLQNREIQTICAPYSLRPTQGATVSTPLHWSEVKKGLDVSRFTILTATNRVNEGELFAGVLGEGIDLTAVLKSLVSNSKP